MNEKEITITRVYDASPEEVWKAWTDPAELMRWWGPDNVTIPECEVDLRIGGKFYIVMKAGEAMGEIKGTLWPMLAEFTAIEENLKLSYTAQAWTEGMKEETMIDQTTDITLTEEEGKTKVVVMAAIQKTGPKAKMAAEGMEWGFTQQMEKLNVYLARQA